MKLLAVMFAAFGLTYLGVSFVILDANPANWPQLARFVALLAGLTLTGMAYGDDEKA